jgi:hypothetical protein
MKTRRRFAPLGILFGLLGLLLFGYFVRKAGVGEIIAGIRRLGIGFLFILAISSIRHFVRSLAWMKCVEPPFVLRFRDALAARLMGDALGNIIPLASIAVSEPSKAVFVKDRIPLMISLSALAVENIFYSLSVCLFIFSGTATLLLEFPATKTVALREHWCTHNCCHHRSTRLPGSSSASEVPERCSWFFRIERIARSAMAKIRPRAEVLKNESTVSTTVASAAF